MTTVMDSYRPIYNYLPVYAADTVYYIYIIFEGAGECGGGGGGGGLG